MMGWKKKVIQARAHDMARGIDAAVIGISKRPALEEVSWQVVFLVLTKMAEELRLLSLSRGDGKASSNDVAQGILWAIEGMKDEFPPDDLVRWTDVALDLSLRATKMRVELGMV